MTRLGIISGPTLLKGRLFGDLEQRQVENAFGRAEVLLSDQVAFIPRHGLEGSHYILPHLINHPANLQALKDLGVQAVLAVNSTGSLKKHLRPGQLVLPDDFLTLEGTPTIFHDRPVHITPTLSRALRRQVLEAARDCGTDVVDGGIYWQTRGPRLETRAEIAMMSQFADLVGMTLASEAVIAGEMQMAYASLCSVDNYAHGLGEWDLTMEEIVQHARRNAAAVANIIGRYMERRGNEIFQEG